MVKKSYNSQNKINDLNIHFGAETIVPVDAVHFLDMILDNDLILAKSIAKFTSICYYNLRQIKQVRQILGSEITAWLMSAYIVSRPDFCNAVLADVTKASIMPLRVKNTAARLIKLFDLLDHISGTIRDQTKLCLMMLATSNHRCPGHFAELLTVTSSVHSCFKLWSASINCYKVSLDTSKVWKGLFRLREQPTQGNNGHTRHRTL